MDAELNHQIFIGAVDKFMVNFVTAHSHYHKKPIFLKIKNGC